MVFFVENNFMSANLMEKKCLSSTWADKNISTVKKIKAPLSLMAPY